MRRERRLETQLVSRFGRTVWLSVAGYAAVVLIVFAALSELQLARSLRQTADVVESLIGLYADPEGQPTTVAPAMLAEQLVGMDHAFAITREVGEDDMRRLYYLSPDMPAQRLEGIGPTSPDEMRDLILAEITDRARWRYRVGTREAGAFQIYVIAGRSGMLAALAGLAAVAAILVPVTAIPSRRFAGRVVREALGPLHAVGDTMRSIGPDDVDRRLPVPTGQAEVTELAETINRALERLDRALCALKAFTADASHELRTPLTHIRAQAQWAQEEGRSADQMRDAIAHIEREVDRTNKMVDDLLLLARGENGQLALNREPFDLSEVATEVHEIAVAMADARDLKIRSEVRDPAPVVGDPDRTRHVLYNLVSNAVRYTPQGQVQIALREDGGRWGVEVRDTGIGIAPEHLERIFDRFYRVEPSRSRAHGGAGLGLTIARLLAELQEGTITVETEQGRGSAFTLWLPARDVPDTPPGTAGVGAV